MENFDNTQANAEGWGVFDCGGSEGGRWQFQRIDDPAAWDALPFNHPQFDSDEDVWRHIAKRADGGSPYHLSALTLMKHANPIEWNLIFVTVLDSVCVAALGSAEGRADG